VIFILKFSLVYRNGRWPSVLAHPSGQEKSCMCARTLNLIQIKKAGQVVGMGRGIRGLVKVPGSMLFEIPLGKTAS
jgi:hypothetical protein